MQDDFERNVEDTEFQPGREETDRSFRSRSDRAPVPDLHEKTSVRESLEQTVDDLRDDEAQQERQPPKRERRGRAKLDEDQAPADVDQVEHETAEIDQTGAAQADLNQAPASWSREDRQVWNQL